MTTAKGLTTMFPGKKKNRTSEAALLNLSFSRAACLPFAIILLCGRVETNSINPVSQGKVTGQKPCIHAGLSRFNGHSHSMASVLSSRHSSCTQFSASTRNACRRMTRCRVSSASWTKAGTTSKTFFQTQGIEFLFLSQSARRVAFGGSMAPKTPVLKLNRPFARKPPAAIASELTWVACAPFAKPQVAGLRHS